MALRDRRSREAKHNILDLSACSVEMNESSHRVSPLARYIETRVVDQALKSQPVCLVSKNTTKSRL